MIFLKACMNNWYALYRTIFCKCNIHSRRFHTQPESWWCVVMHSDVISGSSQPNEPSEMFRSERRQATQQSRYSFIKHTYTDRVKREFIWISESFCWISKHHISSPSRETHESGHHGIYTADLLNIWKEDESRRTAYCVVCTFTALLVLNQPFDF